MKPTTPRPTRKPPSQRPKPVEALPDHEAYRSEIARLREQFSETEDGLAAMYEIKKAQDRAIEDLKRRLAEAERERDDARLSFARVELEASALRNRLVGLERSHATIGDANNRLQHEQDTLRADNERLRGEVERLRLDADMACIEPRDDCDCAGCLCAAEYHQRTPTDAEPEGDQDADQGGEG